MFEIYEKLAILNEKPDMIYEVGSKTYLFFAKPGTTLTSQANWSICLVETNSGTTTIKWANGQRNFDLIADNYATYTYSFKKFV